MTSAKSGPAGSASHCAWHVTATVPLGVPAEPEQQAAVAVWLRSDAASYLTGIAIRVDGGLTAG